jgi:hypothetical protein
MGPAKTIFTPLRVFAFHGGATGLIVEARRSRVAHRVPPMPEGYQVIARRWRPKQFDEIVGQEHIVRTLKNAITQNRLAHAYLFVGPRQGPYL